MPKHRPEVVEGIKRSIRDARALDPLISQNRLLQTLEKKHNRTFDFRYINKLSEKVAREVRMEADHKAIEARLITITESFRMARQQLLRIIYWTSEEKDIKQPYAEEIVKAVTALVQLDLALLDAELNAGMYKKSEETIIAELRYKPLPVEIREQIVQTYRVWGRLPEKVIAEIVPAPVHDGAAAG